MSNKKRYTILGIAFAFALTSLGALAFTVNLATAKSTSETPLNPQAEVVKECTWGQIKDCFSDNPSPGNTCCPKKKEQASVSSIDGKELAITWGNVKCMYHPDGCKKKKKEQVAASTSDYDGILLAKTATWGQIKCMYDPKCSGKKEG